MTLLEVEGIEAGYGKLTVLHDVSLKVAKGEIVGLVGPNGAGKSTLIKSIFRLLPLSTGSVTFDGLDLGVHDARELAGLGMGYVPQEGSTFPGLSVDENLSVSLLPEDRADAAAARARVYERFPALAKRRRQQASTLSGGERQMLALAGGIAASPRFLALDEPTTGLAPSIVEGLIAQIHEYRQGGSGILWVIEENPLQVLHHVDRVYLMQGGVIEQELSAERLLADESLRELFFGATAPPAGAARSADEPREAGTHR